MCGNFGYVGKDTLSPNKIYGAYQLQRHRGPDDHGAESFIALIIIMHARLISDCQSLTCLLLSISRCCVMMKPQ